MYFDLFSTSKIVMYLIFLFIIFTFGLKVTTVVMLRKEKKENKELGKEGLHSILLNTK